MGPDEPHNLSLASMERLIEKLDTAEKRVTELEAALRVATEVGELQKLLNKVGGTVMPQAIPLEDDDKLRCIGLTFRDAAALVAMHALIGNMQQWLPTIAHGQGTLEKQAYAIADQMLKAKEQP